MEEEGRTSDLISSLNSLKSVLLKYSARPAMGRRLDASPCACLYMQACAPGLCFYVLSILSYLVCE